MYSKTFLWIVHKVKDWSKLSCRVIGWGLDEGKAGSYALRQADVQIVDKSICQRKHPATIDANWKNILCAMSPNLLSPVGIGLVKNK